MENRPKSNTPQADLFATVNNYFLLFFCVCTCKLGNTISGRLFRYRLFNSLFFNLFNIFA